MSGPESLAVGRLRGLPVLVRLIIAVGLGALASTAMPPVGIVAAMVPAFAGLLLLLSVSQTKRGGFTIGWGFAFGFHLFGLSWIGEAFLVDAEKFAWMLPFAVGGLPAGLAIIAGIAGALFVRTRTRHIGRNIVLFSVLFMAAEWMRGHLFTGFPGICRFKRGAGWTPRFKEARGSDPTAYPFYRSRLSARRQWP